MQRTNEYHPISLNSLVALYVLSSTGMTIDMLVFVKVPSFDDFCPLSEKWDLGPSKLIQILPVAAVSGALESRS